MAPQEQLRKNLDEESRILKILEFLVCPKCHGELRYDRANQKLVCDNCRLAFPIIDGIPVMLLDRAEKLEE